MSAGILGGLVVSLLSGLYTSLWGGFKDSPWEGFKPRTFPRSILFSAAIFAFLLAVPVLRERVAELGFVQLFFLVMGLERFLTELHKGCFREEPQEKYFVPSALTILGRPGEKPRAPGSPPAWYSSPESSRCSSSGRR